MAGSWTVRAGARPLTALRFVLAKGLPPLWPGRCWPDRWNFQFGGCLAGGPLVPALLRASHGGGGNAQVLGDTGSPRRKRDHLGPLVDSAVSEHLRKKPGTAAQGGMIWARQGRFPRGALESSPWPLQDFDFSFLVRGIYLEPFTGGTWETRALVAMEPGAKDSRV